MHKNKSSKDRGKVIRLSTEVLNYLKAKRKRKSRESFDSVLRRILGLNKRCGETQKLNTYYILSKEPMVAFEKRAEARGQAILRAVRAKTKKTEKPIKVKETV